MLVKIKAILAWCAGVIGGLLVLAAQTSYEDTTSNLASWATGLGLSLPQWLSGANVDRNATVVGGIGIAVAFAALLIWIARRARKSEGSRRLPLTEFYQEANRQHWDFGGNTGHLFDIASGLRQAGADGEIQFYGTRAHRIPALTEDGFYEDIPRDYWKTCSISAISPMKLDPRDGAVVAIGDDNKKTESYNPAGGFDRLTYCDLHVNRGQAMRWLKTEAKQYMGRFRDS